MIRGETLAVGHEEINVTCANITGQVQMLSMERHFTKLRM
jgi:hypothetical protein